MTSLALRINARGTIICTDPKHLDRCQALKTAFNPATQTVELDHPPKTVHRLLDKLAGHPPTDPLGGLLAPADLADPIEAFQLFRRDHPPPDESRGWLTLTYVRGVSSNGWSHLEPQMCQVHADWYLCLACNELEFKTSPPLRKKLAWERGVTIDSDEADQIYASTGFPNSRHGLSFLVYPPTLLADHGIIRSLS